MRFVSWLIFVPLQLLWIPFSILGVGLVAYKQMVVSKQLGVSQTAIEVFNGRWTMHVFEMRADEPTARLGKVLPNTSTFGLWLVLIPIWVKWKIAGDLAIYPRIVERGAEGLGELITARTLYFDEVIERVLGDMEQFVLMGAGYDTRAFGELRREGVAFFELDQESTQTHKRKMLDEAGVDTSGVAFVTVDFSKDEVFERLVAAGFDPAKKTLFLWEGVTLYLSEEAVRHTMQQVRDHAPKGSVLLADIYGLRLVKMGKSKVGEAALGYTNEGFGFGLPFETAWDQQLSSFVESEAFAVGETYFMGSFAKKGPFMVVVEMVV